MSNVKAISTKISFCHPILYVKLVVLFFAICFRGTIKSREHGLQTLLYFIQMTSSYVLMLIIMTFNAWVFASAVAGLGLGYFLCGWAYPESDDKISCQDLCSSDKTHCHGNGDTEQELKLLPSPSAAECEECSIWRQWARCGSFTVLGMT